MADPITASSAAPLIAKVAAELAAPAKGLAARAKEQIEVKFRKGFEAYIQKQLERATTIKTIVSSSTPIPLLTLYVNLFVRSGSIILRDEDFVREINSRRKVIFTATAGAGKSMLMRYLFLQFLYEQNERLPVFIELRDLNQRSDSTLLMLIREKIGTYIDGFSEQHLKFALNSKRLVLLLDGFDEINHDIRKQREREINEIAVTYDDLWIFVSSRPAETFANWEKFHVFSVQPFTKNQVELLISKVPYDADIKQLFHKKLDEGLYETHREFLTNPLLTIMMLVTLEQFAEVPAKIHLFYEYAFEALFGRHDVTKGGFQRKRHCTLALDDFKRLFSYFCMITYIRKRLNFSTDTLLGFIQQSVNSSQIVVDKDSFKNDLTESTCMLVMDGLDYTFSHRSFQEYFASYFLSRVKVDEIANVVPKLIEISGAFDNVLKMLSEMNHEKFEEAWALPTLDRLSAQAKTVNASQNPVGFYRDVFGNPDLHVFGDQELEMGPNSSSWQERYALYSIYDVFTRIETKLNKLNRQDLKKRDEMFLKKIKSGEILDKDERFEELRTYLHESKRERRHSVVTVKLSDADEKWIRDLSAGKFAEIEARVLVELREEVKARVTARQKGIASIFN